MIRFKQDNGELYPKWDSIKMKHLTIPYKVRNRNCLPLDIYSVNNKVGFLPQSEQFEEAGYLNETDTSIYMIAPPKHFAYNPARINVGSIGYQNLGKDVQISSLYEVFKTTEECYDPFIWHWFSTEYFKRMVNKYQEGGVRLYYYYDKLCETPISLPCIEEQKKIATFLSNIDEVIQETEREITALDNLKKGVTQKIFNQEVRFKSDDGKEYPKWEENFISHYLEERNEKQVPDENAPLMAFVANQGITDKGEKYDRSFLVKSEDKKYKRTELNDFIYSSNNLDVGSIGLNKYGSAVISVVYEIFKMKNNVIPECLNAIIQEPKTMHSIIRYRQGCLYGQYKIHPYDFLSVKIRVPCLEEQRKIADFLSDFDTAIEEAKKELEQWKLLKKGLLQQMFE